MKHKPAKQSEPSGITSSELLGDIRRMIDEARAAVATTVNAGLTMLYWRIGKRIRGEVLQEKRAEYGREIVVSLSRQLQAEYGNGFSEKSSRHMMRFAEVFPDGQIVSAVMRQLSWTHFLSIIYLKDSLQREFYAEMCRIERWSTRSLQREIESMLYERTALSKKPEAVAKLELAQLREEDTVSPDLVFKDPYFLDFLGLRDHYLEKDLEDAILRELELFLLELGVGFSFVARQKRIQIDSDDFCIDLLLFNRKLRRRSAIAVSEKRTP